MTRNVCDDVGFLHRPRDAASQLSRPNDPFIVLKLNQLS